MTKRYRLIAKSGFVAFSTQNMFLEVDVNSFVKLKNNFSEYVDVVQRIRKGNPLSRYILEIERIIWKIYFAIVFSWLLLLFENNIFCYLVQIV